MFKSLKYSCPICSGASRGHGRGGRECKENSGLVFCITGREGYCPPGWVQVGIDRNGLFGLFARSDSQSEFRKKGDREGQYKQSNGKQRYLSTDERHFKIEQLLKQLELNPEDKQRLLDRGLTEKEIKYGGFRSVKSYQKLTNSIKNLFGVSYNGRNLIVAGDGILCPFRNEGGKWIGWQVRLHDGGDGGKYRWPSSKTQKNPDGLSLHFAVEKDGYVCNPDYPGKQNGIALPLAWYVPSMGEDGNRDRKEIFKVTQKASLEQKQKHHSNWDIIKASIALAEGISFKPFLISSRLECPAIGAAGGNFASNPEYFRGLYYDKIWRITGNPVGNFIIFPDAGAIENFNVLTQYAKAVAEIKDTHHNIYVAWWGQYDKTHRDIDEEIVRCNSESALKKFVNKKLKLISWEEFLGIAYDRLVDKFVVENLNNTTPGQAGEKITVRENKNQDRGNGSSAGVVNFSDADGIEVKIGKNIVETLTINSSNSRKKVNRLVNRIQRIGDTPSSKELDRREKLKGQENQKASISDESISNTNEKNDKAAELIDLEKIQEQRKRAELIALLEYKTWLASGKFTPDETISEKYLPVIQPQKGQILAIKSPMGSGKTETIKNLIANLDSIKATGAVLPGSRNSLLIQTAERVGAYHLYNDNASDLLRDPDSVIALCADSLWKYRQEDFDNKLVIIDEANSFVDHLLVGGTIRDRKKQICSLLGEMIRRSHSVVLLDANLSDLCVKYLTQLAEGAKQIKKIENVHDVESRKIYMMNGSVDEISLESNLRDKSGIVAELLYALGNGKKCVIPLDTQIYGEALDNLLQKEGYSGIRFDSKTTADDLVKEMLKTINESIQSIQPDYLIYTPSCESGVDISLNPYFDNLFAVFVGVISTDSQLQMLRRVRHIADEWMIYCKDKRGMGNGIGTKSFYADEIMATQVSNHFEELDDLEEMQRLINDDYELELYQTVVRGKIVQEIIEEIDSPHYKTAMDIKAKKNYEFANLRKCLVDRLSAMGHEVIDWQSETTQEVKKKIEEEVETVKDQNCEDIFNAEDISEEEARRIQHRSASSWEDRCKAEKAYWLHTLPGINRTESWDKELLKLVKYDDPKIVAKLTRRWLLDNMYISDNLLKEKWGSVFRKNNTAFFMDLKADRNKLKALHSLGIPALLQKFRENPDLVWRTSDPEIKEIIEEGRKKAGIYNALGFKPLRHRPFQYLMKCFSLIGIKLKTKQRRKDGDKETIAWIDVETLEENHDQYREIINAIARKWTSKFNSEYQFSWEDQYIKASDIWVDKLQLHPPRTYKKQEESNNQPIPETLTG